MVDIYHVRARYMHDDVAAFERGIEPAAVQQICFEQSEPVGGSDEFEERSHLGCVVRVPDSAVDDVSAIEKDLDDLGSNESGRACDGYLHAGPPKHWVMS
jgi:hypothetical protein